MSDVQGLLPPHFEQLTQGSGIAPEIIVARGYRSIHGPGSYSDLKPLGFSRTQARQTPGLLMPILGPDGQPVLYQYRADTPRLDADGHLVKYESPKGNTMRLDFATGQRDLIGNPAVPLWITEGVKKVDALRSHGLCAIGLCGVWSWRGSNRHGGTIALADWEHIALNGRDVRIVFDSDVTTKREVHAALRRLRGFLAQRSARVQVVQLPANGPEKVGVDDFLLTHSVEELERLASHPSEATEATPAAPPVPYRATRTGITWEKTTKDGSVSIPVTNFTAEIVGDIVADDGAETSRHFELQTSLNGRTHRFMIPATAYQSLNWITEHLGAQALVYPGQSLREHACAAIKQLSQNVVERRIFKHTGWHQNRDGEWFFFHGGGVLGANGHVANMEVSLPSGLDRLVLPEPPTGAALVTAIRASLGMLDVAPDRVTTPPWASIWRAVLGRADLAVPLTGPTGAGKTEVAALVEQHFGAGFDARHLPGSWLSTGNSLAELAFAAKDVVLVIDDFAPGGTSIDIARTHREADRVLRAQGNLAGRGRLRADGSPRPARPPRGLILSTGEDVPRGQSLRARILVIEISPNDLIWDRLTLCQRDAAAGLYAEATGGFIRWLAPRYEQVQHALRDELFQWRTTAYRSGQHRRTPDIVAQLAVGVRYFIAFAKEVGALTTEEGGRLWTRCWTALGITAAAQAQYQAASEPTRRFLELLTAAITSGRAHVAGRDGGEPTTPEAWGWRQRTVGTGDYQRDEWQPQGRRVGWLDSDALYLEPESAYAEVQALAREQGDSLAVSVQTLRKRLHEHKLLRSIDQKRQTLTVRRTLEAVQREVLCMPARILESYLSEKPDKPDNPPDEGAQVPPEESQMSGFMSGFLAPPTSDPTSKDSDKSDSYDANVGFVGFLVGRDTHADEPGAVRSGPMSGRSENPTSDPTSDPTSTPGEVVPGIDGGSMSPRHDVVERQERCGVCGSIDLETFEESGRVYCSAPSCHAVLNPSTGQWHPGARHVERI